MLLLLSSIILLFTNAGADQRQEVAAVPLDSVCARLGCAQQPLLVITDATGQEVDWQVTYDRQLLLDVSAQQGQTVRYEVRAAVPERFYAVQPIAYTAAGGYGVGRTWAQGRYYPDRLDDVAWENDRGAYRLYGPAFAASGGQGYGPDVWAKNTPLPDIDRRFRLDIDTKPAQRHLERLGYTAEHGRLLREASFHIDHGNGGDCYAVGTTLGCGGAAVVTEKYENTTTTGEKKSVKSVVKDVRCDSLVFQPAWQQYEILDNGPLRFTVRFTFAPRGGATETRVYTLDKGENFNRVTVSYACSGPITVATGFPLHEPNAATLRQGADYMQYADPTDNPSTNASQLYIACLYPDKTVPLRMARACGHALAYVTLQPGQQYTYYAGSAWSKYDVRNQREWQERINTKLQLANSKYLSSISN